MTIANVIDVIAGHLAKQRKRAHDVTLDSCQYRGPEGTMCAVGCLIPDGIYSKDFEGASADDLLNTGANYGVRDHLISLAPDIDPSLLGRFLFYTQLYHDCAEYADDSDTASYTRDLKGYLGLSDEALKALIVGRLNEIYEYAVRIHNEDE